MDILLGLIGVVLAGVFVGVMWWGISEAKRRFDLDPDGRVYAGLAIFEEKGAQWIIQEATRIGDNLSLENSRLAWADEAVRWVAPKIPKLMDEFNYSPEDLKRDIAMRVNELLAEQTGRAGVPTSGSQ